MKKNYFITLFVLASAITFGQNAPVDFEPGGNGASWTWTVFENDSNPSLQIVPNPDPSGINTSSTVAKFTALQAGNPWAGCETQHGSDIGTFSITSSNNIVRIMVYKTKISDVGIKLVTSSAASLGEIKVANTVINQWEQLTFDFSAHIGGMTYDQLVVFPDFVARSADDIIYFDNVFGDPAFLSTEELTKPQLTLFPNPTNDIVNFDSETPIDRVELFTIDGKSLIVLQNVKSIDLSNFDTGIYIVKTLHNGVISTQRVVKN
ncbi:T9SS type A sorting domain-containing protein [Flavobacteriales bacterium]|nr:T9SS type A sorting domain-containing protein [Flavobacteriales bacterium]MDB4051861.1 T9SS type A sorting domain-containing protein [Flavobacteriales bacterium]MDB4195673.1 T9SS type A sorting domain-containing protein [Flavobacteriales bacterium]